MFEGWMSMNAVKYCDNARINKLPTRVSRRKEIRKRLDRIVVIGTKLEILRLSERLLCLFSPHTRFAGDYLDPLLSSENSTIEQGTTAKRGAGKEVRMKKGMHPVQSFLTSILQQTGTWISACAVTRLFWNFERNCLKQANLNTSAFHFNSPRSLMTSNLQTNHCHKIPTRLWKIIILARGVVASKISPGIPVRFIFLIQDIV